MRFFRSGGNPVECPPVEETVAGDGALWADLPVSDSTAAAGSMPWDPVLGNVLKGSKLDPLLRSPSGGEGGCDLAWASR